MPIELLTKFLVSCSVVNIGLCALRRVGTHVAFHATVA